MKLYLSWIIAGLTGLLITFLLLTSSCTEKVETIPAISSFTISHDTVESGGIALLTTHASDEDGDELVYFYVTTGGSITGYGDSVYWFAPVTGGVYRAIVRVTDPAGNQSIDSINLVVLNSGNSEIVGTASFPEGMNYDLSESKVRLFTSLAARQAGQCTDSTVVFGFGSIVSFKFPSVPPGTYYLDVWKDVDKSVNISTGDFMGWYGKGDFISPDLRPVTVVENTPFQAQIQVQVKL